MFQKMSQVVGKERVFLLIAGYSPDCSYCAAGGLSDMRMSRKSRVRLACRQVVTGCGEDVGRRLIESATKEARQGEVVRAMLCRVSRVQVKVKIEVEATQARAGRVRSGSQY